jgi:chromosome segregation protein
LLKLKRVELQGFKSFPERTELRFNGSGIAGVIGPNGCGKSNIADAINWVLGEQSAKSLRGARMEDVIFAGTRDRKPVGLASVTMTLGQPDDSPAPKLNGAVNGHANGESKPNGHADGTAVVSVNGAVNGKANGKAAEAPDSGKEVIITRRLFRSGESEYLVNGRSARLRDIQDIFMGTGLGPESYAIIEQGRIGQLLSSRPQDRRAVLEEAAGISKFKTRRRLADAKLEGAKHNLERVFDILEEVGRQVNSLKRQAAKAKRYEELKGDLNAQLRRVLAGRYQMLERETAKIALDLNLASSGLETLSTETAAREQEYSRSQAENYETEARLTEARKRLAELNLELERTRGRLESQAKQVGSIDQRIAQGEKDAQDVESRFERARQELSSHQSTLGELDLQTEEARTRLESKNRDREGTRIGVEQRERALEGSRQSVLRLLGEASALKNQLAQIETYLASIERDAAKAQHEEQAAQSDIERLNQANQELAGKRTAQHEDLQTIIAQRRRYEEELSVRKGQVSGARRELETIRTEFSRLKARRDSLEEVISHRSYTTESVKRLFTAIDKGQVRELKPAGVLADFVDVDPAYEKAVEEFLHDELEFIVVEDWKQAESGIEVMRGGVDGRATFLVHNPHATPAPADSVGPEPSVSAGTGVAARLRDVLKLANGMSSASLASLPRLGGCFLTSERNAAQTLAMQYPHLYFLAPDGVCYHGNAVSGGKKTSSGPLALKRELRELKAHVQARQKKLDETSGRIQELETEIVGTEQEIERLRSSQQNREKEVLALDHEVRKITEEAMRANSRLQVARQELERLGRERERSVSKQESNRQAVEEKDRTRLVQEEAMQAARQELEALKKDSTRVLEEHSALRVQLAEFEERRRGERNAMGRLESQIRELTGRKQNLAAEGERLGIERSRLLASNIELDQRTKELAGQVSNAGGEVTTLAQQEAAIRTKLAELEENLKQLRALLQEAQEKRSQIELDLVRRQAELKYLDETSRKELNVAVAELASAEEVTLDDAALEEADRRCQELRSRIESLGPVNPDALAEHKEAQQRYDFLNVQRQDLLDSIRDTEKAIHEIDVESRKRFSEAFAAINANFRELFLTLFGGGTCEMRLTDEENVTESGIDIVASPPGKRLQNVLLLSGGEKALTALSLLMAIFKYQPSPFCILDEVDAPLDEPNIERLTRLIKEMSAQTQFIIITHAKRTMEAAQMLYGVTMQEPGVSRVVSVKFQPMPPPPPPRTLEIARA